MCDIIVYVVQYIHHSLSFFLSRITVTSEALLGAERNQTPRDLL